ncbi:MAG: phosphoribosylformylglycinamidine cyclo-ligase [bacterium]|uniref:Phosphoribosylformylglycinamidine cyclo-ligase n=1 Tax=candidate division TA06 bacterium 34_109 TaxID=1635277 RepID=A0A117M654_UNCT6|nr:MAG: Phosphoribosylformylglycinamidine cyclo-ligase [candidate division TA06 bacterium 34_109]MDI6699634.1 phosphoribosylformylglycinamidine cyclo-ligase [bacterium]
MKYKDSGVNISKANQTVKDIKKLVRSTYSKNVLSDIGIFGSIYSGKFSGYKKPVLVSSCDGVGTKVLIAEQVNFFDHLGEDIVNHSVNDILAVGAKPLYFLDYIGMGKLERNKINIIISSMVKACKYNSLSLVGGELAEMSDVYNFTHYDIVGFIVGICEKDNILTGQNIKKGDHILGLPSNGFHTNGYSLIRNIIKEKNLNLKKPLKNSKIPLYKELLKPHMSYFNQVYPLIEKKKINGIAHITGGGFKENIKRILPQNVDAIIETSSWEVPNLFKNFCQIGNIKFYESYRVFNMGIGMVLIVSKKNIASVENFFKKIKIEYRKIGYIVSGKGNVSLVR